MKKDLKLILASQSPRRKMLLSHLGLPLDIFPAHIDETMMDNESPTDYVSRVALKKVKWIAEKTDSDNPILAADTVVVFNDEILGKPKDEESAIKMWSKLSGVFHTVITSYVIFYNGKTVQNSVFTKVKFKKISLQEMQAYLKCNEWKDKAGGYAVQGISGFWVESIDGSYTNVVGLPLTEVARDLNLLCPHFPPFPWEVE